MNGETRIECRFAGDSIWLSQLLMADLFQVTVPTINGHLKNLYQEGEIQPDPTIRKFRTVRQEGSRQVTREIDHYNLDAILSVGYRVRSHRGTQFRIWATQRLRPSDYDPSVEGSTLFFKTVLNKMHWAARCHTAAEIVHKRTARQKSGQPVNPSQSPTLATARQRYQAYAGDVRRPPPKSTSAFRKTETRYRRSSANWNRTKKCILLGFSIRPNNHHREHAP